MNTIATRIARLKKERDAVILVHNYQLPEVQDIADHLGDSLELAQLSRHLRAHTVVFCGVRFMAEMTKLFDPAKTVLMPDLHAGCPMADMISPEELRSMREEHPAAAVIAYVNSTAAVKALADVCCTSANGVAVARSRREKEVIFVPDQYLGTFVARQVPEKRFHLARGYCPTHMLFTPHMLEDLKKRYPGAVVLAHPECRVEVQDMADAICSTSQMITYAKGHAASTYIICTEIGMLHRLERECPGKRFVPGNPNALCPNMKLTTLESVLWALESGQHEVTVDPGLQPAALRAITRMVEIGS